MANEKLLDAVIDLSNRDVDGDIFYNDGALLDLFCEMATRTTLKRVLKKLKKDWDEESPQNKYMSHTKAV